MKPLTPSDQAWLDNDYAPRSAEVWADRKPNQNIFDFLADDARVIEVVGMTSDKRLVVIDEACDGAFGVALNKLQMAELINALQELHAQMKD